MKKSSLHAFISYRRGGGAVYARNVADRLKSRKMKVFLDVDSMPSGHFDETLYRKIEEAANFIIICTPGCLDRCKEPEDWVRAEIVHAIKHNKNIIPVFAEGFTFPAKESLPDEIRAIATHQGSAYNHELFDAFIEKLVSLMVLKRKKAPIVPLIIAVCLVLAAVSATAIFFNKKSTEVGHPFQKESAAPLPLPVAPPQLDQGPQPEIAMKKREEVRHFPRENKIHFKSALSIMEGNHDAEIISALKGMHDFESLSGKLRDLKAQGKLMFGKKSTFMNPANCYVAIIEKETKTVVALLGKGGGDRVNLLTNGNIRDFENGYKDKTSIWIEIY